MTQQERATARVLREQTRQQRRQLEQYYWDQLAKAAQRRDGLTDDVMVAESISPSMSGGAQRAPKGLSSRGIRWRRD
jgi:hypothetical protein